MTSKNPTIQPDTLLTSYDVGGLLQVNPSSINKWIKDGRITAFRTPGGHRRIRARDLVEFLSKHDMPVPKPLVNATRRRLLVVEREAKVRTALTNAAAKEQFDITVVDNAIDGLMQVGSYKPHVVLWDAETSDIDAGEACKRIKASQNGKEIRIVVAARNASNDLDKKLAQAGATKLLAKPVLISSLVEELEASSDLTY